MIKEKWEGMISILLVMLVSLWVIRDVNSTNKVSDIVIIIENIINLDVRNSMRRIETNSIDHVSMRVCEKV